MRKKDIVGQKFWKIFILSNAPPRRDSTTGKSRRYVLGKCDCGTIGEFSVESLLSGHTKSCGCYNIEKIIERSTKHGKTYTRAYQAWCNMKQRCTNPNAKEFRLYKGRKICPEWLNNFEQFYADNGDPPPGMTLERIDNKLGYFKGNCEWRTRRQQSRNTNWNRNYTVLGVSGCLTDLCAHFGITYAAARSRIDKLKWPLERVFTEPVRPSYRSSVLPAQPPSPHQLPLL